MNTAITINSIFRLFILLIFLCSSSCEPEACRDCTAFNYEYEKLINYRSKMKFRGSNDSLYEFIKIDESISPAKIDCERTSDMDLVVCRKEANFKFKCDKLTSFIYFSFDQYEEFEQEIIDQDVYLRIGIGSTIEDDYSGLQPFHGSIINPVQSIDQELIVDSIQIENKDYRNVIKYEITQEEVDEYSNNNKLVPKLILIHSEYGILRIEDDNGLILNRIN